MDVGIQCVFSSYGWSGVSDSEVYRDETALALLAEELGFDVLWCVEHHFFDYSFCPDNTQLLSYFAGRTSRIELGTAAVIMPWNEPLRVAEKISMLDELSGGRLRFGMGRGLSRREYDLFPRIGMDESRERFDEGAAMVVEALETGFMEGHGTYYPQPRTAIRPAPTRTFKGRTYAVANSDDSVDAAARLGAAMVMFADRSWKSRLPSIERWRALYREVQDAEPPPPLTADFVFCHADAAVAAEKGRKYLTMYLQSILEHYEIMGSHFEGVTGYDAYAAAAEHLRKLGAEPIIEGFLHATAFGTPEQVIETYRTRWELIGPYEAAPAFRFGGIPFDEAEAGMRLFAAEVLPELKSWT